MRILLRFSSVLILCLGVFSVACSSSVGDGGNPDDTPGPIDTGDCPMFPADNPWNTDISALSVHSNSDDFIAAIGAGTGMHADFGTFYEGVPNGFRYAIVPEDQPGVPIEFDYAPESDPGPYPIPDDPPIEASASGGGDRHLVLIQEGVCLLWEIFEAYKDDDGWHGGSGAKFDLNSNDLRPDGWTSADAAGLPIFPGLVRYEEVEAGEIAHALRITVPHSQDGFIHPATHQAGSSGEDLPPMGLRLRLKSEVDISGYTSRIQVILRALKKYGAFVADNGSAWYLSGVHDSKWDDDELRQLGSIKGGDFEAVYTGEILTH